jgi:hypothetical protein
MARIYGDLPIASLDTAIPFSYKHNIIIHLFLQKGTQILQVGKSVPFVRADVLQHHPAGISFAGRPQTQQVGLVLGFWFQHYTTHHS